MAVKLKGVDVSFAQGEINWNKVSGIDFVIIRAGYGKNNIDAWAIKNIQGCKSRGIPYGLYWFSYALSVADAEKEAGYVCDIADKYGLTFPIIGYDWEYHSDEKAQANGVTMTNSMRTAFAKAFMEKVKQRKYTPVLYTNYDYLNKGFRELINSYDVWFSYPSGSTTPDVDNLTIWQYSWKGNVSGVNADVDMNMCYKDYRNGAQPTNSTTVTPTASTPSVVYKVRTNGSWLEEVKDLDDYAGISGKAITDVAIKATKGSIKYRVHVKGGSWLPYVTGYNTNDDDNGYAGDHKPIDAIEVYYTTPSDVVGTTGYLKAKYRVSPLSRDYFSWQYDNEKTNGQDGYAGDFGASIDRLQIIIAK